MLRTIATLSTKQANVVMATESISAAIRNLASVCGSQVR